jgi:hypothetical protein
MVSFHGKFRPGLTRILTAICGACSVAWTASVISSYRAEDGFTSAARNILSMDKYSPEQLSELKQRVDTAQTGLLRPSALNDIAIIRLRLAEVGVASGNAELADASLNNLDPAVIAALAANPTNSFSWLTEYWLQGERAGDPKPGMKFLRMSYLLGPNEGWIAVRRNPLALSSFSSLPAELAGQTLSEFAGLVRSRLYTAAADILVGPGWAVRDRLAGSLADIDKDRRREFASVLENKDIEGVSIPGVGESPSFRF